MTKLLIITVAVLSALSLSTGVQADDTFDGYWYCPTAIYPRIDGEPAPEVGCTETEPVFISDDGTATGVTTGVYRELPSTGAGLGWLLVAGLLVTAGGGVCRASRSG